MSIEQFDNDFATYVADKETRKKIRTSFHTLFSH